MHDVLEERHQVRRVAAEQHRLEEHAVPEGVEDLAHPDVGVVVAGRPDRRVVVGAADRRGAGAAQLDRGAAVGQQQVVGGREAVEEQRLAGGVGAHAVAEDRGDVGLVDRDPVLDAVGEPLAHDGGVLGEPVDGVAVEPAAVVLERLRQVPVVERDHRLLAVLEEGVDEAVVERQPLLVGRPAPGRLDARPGDREAVAARAELLHQRDVLVDPVVVVAGDLAAAAVDDACRARR